MSNSNQIGLQTFNTAFPLDFVLQNQNQGADLSVLYIVDNVDNKSSSQQIKVVITANSEDTYDLTGYKFTPPSTPQLAVPSNNTLLTPQNSTFTPDESKYNLAIAVRPGTLRSSVQENFSNVLYNGINKALQQMTPPNSCVVHGPITRNSDGALIWYIAFENSISSSKKTVAEWTKTEGTTAIDDILYMPDGTLFAIGTDTNYYSKPSVTSGEWTIETGTHKASNIALNSAGVLTAVRASNSIMYTVDGSIDGAWTEIPMSGEPSHITILPNGYIVSTNSVGQLWYWNPAAPEWVQVLTTTKIGKIAARPDGSIVGIGLTDFLLYQRNSLENSEWEPLDRITCLSAVAIAPDGSILAYSKTNNNFYKENVSNSLLNFTLEGVSAAAGTGARSSQVELLFGNVSVNASANTMSFKRSAHIDIVNHEGHSYAPLYFGVLGDGTLLNEAGKANDLSIYFETTNGKPIQLGSDESPTKIDFSFSSDKSDSDGSDSELMTFGSPSEVAAYQLSTSEKYPFSTSGLAVNEGEGSYKISAEFKNLKQIKEANTPDEAKSQTKSSNAYLKTTSKSGNWSTIQTRTKNIATQLASFMTATGGPLKMLSNANAISGGGHFERHWNNAISYNGDSNGDSSWDTMPNIVGWTPPPIYTAENPWTDKEFLLYVVTNYEYLTEKLSGLNSTALTSAYDIYPCEVTFQFFRLYYDLDKKLAEDIKNPPIDIGSQELAERYLKVSQNEMMFQNFQSMIKLASFYLSNEGPLMQLALQNGVVSPGETLEDILPNAASGQDGLLFLPLFENNNNGSSLTMFSQTTWQTNYRDQVFLDYADRFPPGIEYNFDVSNPWGTKTGTKVYTYISNNFDLLVTQFIAAMGEVWGSEIPIIPSKCVAAFFYMQYDFQNQYSNLSSTFMLDISQAITRRAWDIAFAQAVQVIPSANKLLTQSAINNNSQIWSTDFITYLNSTPNGTKRNFQTLVEGVSFPISPTGSQTKYVIPCQILFDYLMSSYQITLGSPSEENLPQLHQCTSYVFPFKNLQISGSDGVVTLNINVQNLPGYWDTTFQIPIKKSKSILDPTLKLGHSGNHGRVLVLPTDPNYTNPKGLNPGSRIDFLSGKLTSQKANVSIEEYYGLNLFGTQADPEIVEPAVESSNTAGAYDKTGQPVRIKDADLLIEDGRLGIGNVPQGYLSGDFSHSGANDPDEKLRVVGNTYANGRITTSDDANIGGNISTQGNLIVQGNILANGGVIGPNIFPTGATLQRLAPYNESSSTPEGWLACDGSDLMQKLITTPDPPQNGPALNQVLHSEFLPLFMYLAEGMNITYIDKDDSNDQVTRMLSPTTQIKLSPNGSHKHKLYFYDTEKQEYSLHAITDTQCALHLPTLSTTAPSTQGSYTDGNGTVTNFNTISYLIKL